MEPEETLQLLETEDLSQEHIGNRKSLGHFAFALMLLVGMAAVWLYTRGSRFYDPAYISGLIQGTRVQRIFANPTQVGVIFSVASILALWIARRRRNLSLNILES
jgi:hypothetical protein